ncbi:hypothetical protein AKJ62_01290 [candidate division MSBL1 archaeon SCGC-AAA259D14]|uniref:Uncharacterized protein n=1 Tax=candidate division MSBL1 archaeon SCGC-AAA259D14 TaxID=1698261 RepID=A0A133U7Z3_9EURY|nr:hypothetical protein AKJ62_01290 [candidate division MSBL1 archaeon SCGC-AAA259D14]
MRGDRVKTKPREFKTFLKYLVKSAPDNYISHLFSCRRKGKDPDVYRSWKSKKERLPWKKAYLRLKKQGNVGIAGMPWDDLVNVDIDDEETTDKEDLNPTLMARSRSRTGLHAWYFSKDDIPNIATENAGEIRAQGQYVLAPGSYVPCTEEEIEKLPKEQKKLAGNYTIEEKRPVAWIEMDDLPEVFLEKHEENQEVEERETTDFDPKEANGDVSALYDLTVKDIVEYFDKNKNPRKRWTLDPSNSKFEPIFHENSSSTDANMSISYEGKNGEKISGGVLHCWRHSVTHGPIQVLSVLSNYMDCIKAGTPHKNSGAGPSRVTGDDGAIFHAWKYAKDRNLIPEDDPVPTRALKHIARKHDVYDALDTEKLPYWAYQRALKILEEEY